MTWASSSVLQLFVWGRTAK